MREYKKSLSEKLRMDGRDYSRPGWYFRTIELGAWQLMPNHFHGLVHIVQGLDQHTAKGLKTP